MRAHRILPILLLFATATAAVDLGPEAPVRATQTEPAADPARPPVFARSNYVWPFSTGPYYGKVAEGLRRAAGTLNTAVGQFRPAEGELPLPQALQTPDRLGVVDEQYFIVQFAPGGTGPAKLRELLARSGRSTVGSMPVAAHVARLDASLRSQVRELPGLIALMPYQAAFKLAPAIGRLPHAEPEKAVSNVYELTIRIWDGEPPEPVARAIESLGGTVTHVAINGTLRAELHRERLWELARLPAVRGINEYHVAQARNEKTATTLQTGAYHEGATPYHDAGIDGGGSGHATPQVLMVLDTGVMLDAGDLSDTRATSGLPGNDPTNADPSGDHRKVSLYTTTDAFGGRGDLEGCDAFQSGSFTHGHFVASTALGNASENLPATYGTPFTASDPSNPLDTKRWKIVGVAPAARLVFYDALRVPGNGSCDKASPGLLVGTVYGGTPGTGSLGDAYANYGARVFNFSWGTAENAYSATAEEIDEFIFENPQAMVFLAAGNSGVDQDSDGIPDPGSLGEPATAKNGVAVGASLATSSLTGGGNEELRAEFSSVGPEASSGRIAPQLMAPGADVASSLGPASSYACKTQDNEQTDPVECDVLTGRGGTSMASAAAAGAASLVRGYFAQGFYPEGIQTDANRESGISGALVKALLIASADFMNGQSGPGLSAAYRANHEQGWGRIRLDRALPLPTWPTAPRGLVVVDGDTLSLRDELGGTIDGDIDATLPGTQQAIFEICDRGGELRLALVWTEQQGATMDGSTINDLDLILSSPSGRTYRGNYFTDDENRDGAIDLDTEDCPGVVGGTIGRLDASAWSQPVCEHLCNATTSCPTGQEFSRPDDTNPIEMIALSPDHDGDNQLEVGPWTVTIESRGVGNDPDQDYALVIAGGVCRASSIGFDRPTYACNETFEPSGASPSITVIEKDDPGVDPASGLNAGVVAARTLVRVFDSGDVLVDEETGPALGFEQPVPGVLSFRTTMLTLTDGTGRDPGNGVLDVRDGDSLRAVYTDTTASGPSQRFSSARVDCRTKIASVGQIRFAQFGQDDNLFVNGGCERNARGRFETGAPDRYLDAGERVVLGFGFTSNEADDMTGAVVHLRCVMPDLNSPEDCAPDSRDCADPQREDNADCPYLTITDTPRTIGSIPSGSGLAANFGIVVDDSIAGTPPVELVLEVTASITGKTAKGVSVRRITLNADESSVLYSTDYPAGGTEFQDRNDDERLDNPLSLAERILRDDLRFETVVYSPIFGASGMKNLGLQSPWSFDLNDGGFLSGLNASTDVGRITDVIANWGEDLNFNNQLDYYCSLNETARLPGGRPGCDPDNDQCGSFQICDAGFCSVTGEACTVNGDCHGGVCVSFEDRDVNGTFDALDRNWSTRGGCGWQTRAPGSCSTTTGRACYVSADCPAAETCDTLSPAQTGGAWHTGSVGGTTGTCLRAGGNDGQCAFFGTVGGDTRTLSWVELLLMPEIQRVGGDEVRGEITNWAWNLAIDLPDDNVDFFWEFDTDARSVEPVELFGDLRGSFGSSGPFGSVTGLGMPERTRGWGLFAPPSPDGSSSRNGSVGADRVGENGCFFNRDYSDEALIQSARCAQSTDQRCLPPDVARTIDGLSDPRDDDLKNGLCSHDGSKVCRKACSEEPLEPCNVDGDCTGTCDAEGTPDCVVTAESCTTSAECTTAAGGRCIEYEGTCSSSLTPCVFNADCPGFLNFCSNKSTVCAYRCDVDFSAIDEFVTPAGPIRNFDLQAFDGPDLRLVTLEDAYGKTGEYFRGAIGLRNREPAPNSGDADPGYGLGVDDMVVEWREFVLVEDQTDCAPAGPPGAGGACAALDVATSSFFEGSGLITVTVLETSPSSNDCDDDGAPDLPPEFDCDDDGVPDVLVEATSSSEIAGERVVANRTADPCACEYRAVLPVSATYDAPGVLFVERMGAEPPVATLVYEDLDDGTGQVCENAANGTQLARVVTPVAFHFPSGNLRVTQTIVTDGHTPDTYGDRDGFADTNETVALRIEVTNSTGVALEGVSARLSTNDAAIDCILDSEILVGDLPAPDPSDPAVDPSLLSAGSFRFRVADVQREGICSVTGSQPCELDAECPASEFCTAPFELLTADFTVTFSSRGETAIASAVIPQSITLDLDLDATGGSDPSTYSEDFEIDQGSGGFGSFVSMNLDAFLGSNAAANGYRCQYTDPDWMNSNNYGDYDAELNCYPGPARSGGDAARMKFWWQINSADPNAPSPDGGRAYSGTHSLYFGEYGPAVDENTTPVGMLEAIRTLEPINLGWDRVCRITRTENCSTDNDCTATALDNGCVSSQCSLSGQPCGVDDDCDETCVVPRPLLSFKQQVSLMDNPPHGCVLPVQGTGRAADRAVLQAQFAGTDDPTPELAPGLGPWIKLEPILNGYEIQAVDNFSSCMYDPIDDDSTEDDFFDPTDPTRRLGPSSTCFPEFVWAASGDTGDAFDPTDIWRADGPGLEGSAGLGTWVETRVDLARFRGRRVRLRFLTTGINDPAAVTWEELFSPLNPDDCDDGWWIDDIVVTDTIVNPAQVAADVKSNDDPVSFPACGITCNTVIAQLDMDPEASASVPLPAPGLAVELDAGGSVADRCVDGILQYRFWIDGNGDDVGGNPADTLLRDWTDNPLLLQAPRGTTRFVVDARCSGDPVCAGSTARSVVVDCPDSGNLGGDLFQTVTAPDKTQLVWTTPANVFFAAGDLTTLPAYATSDGGTLAAATALPLGAAQWYLLKRDGPLCNEAGVWTSGGDGEVPGRDLPGGLP